MIQVRHIAAAAVIGFSSLVLLPGCATDHPSDVPSAAVLSTEGSGRLAYTAPSAGTAYIYDDSNGRLIYSGKVDKGQRLTIDSKNDKIELDGNKVSEQTLHTGDTYQIYFDKHPVVEHKIVTEEKVERTD